MGELGKWGTREWPTMTGVLRVDEKNRITIPREARRRAGVKPGSLLLINVKDNGVIELVPVDRLHEAVSRIFEEKMKGWREEDHEATRLLERMVGKVGGEEDS